eukprot:g4200.t1
MCDSGGSVQVLQRGGRGAASGEEVDSGESEESEESEEDSGGELQEGDSAGGEHFKVSTQWTVGGATSAFAAEPRAGVVAVGGKERELSLWSVKTQQRLFLSRNVAHDKLDLRQPVWFTDVHFSAGAQHGSGTGGHGGARFELLAGTAYGQLRLYDSAAQRRPVHSVTVGEYPIMACCADSGSHAAFAGDTTGGVYALDTRTWRALGRFAGPCGAVRTLRCHAGDKGEPLLSCVGLDRFLHVFHRRSRKVRHKVYLKQRQTDLLVTRVGGVGAGAGAGVGEDAGVRAHAAADRAAGTDESGSDGEVFDELEQLHSDEEDDEDDSSDEEDDDKDDEDEEDEDGGIADYSRDLAGVGAARRKPIQGKGPASKRRKR